MTIDPTICSTSEGATTISRDSRHGRTVDSDHELTYIYIGGGARGVKVGIVPYSSSPLDGLANPGPFTSTDRRSELQRSSEVWVLTLLGSLYNGLFRASLASS